MELVDDWYSELKGFFGHTDERQIIIKKRWNPQMRVSEVLKQL